MHRPWHPHQVKHNAWFAQTGCRICRCCLRRLVACCCHHQQCYSATKRQKPFACPQAAASGRRSVTMSMPGSYHTQIFLSNICNICRPQRLGNVWIVPLQSWHHRSFDREPEVPGLPAAAMLLIHDYAACQWPPWMPGRTSGFLWVRLLHYVAVVWPQRPSQAQQLCTPTDVIHMY